MKVLRSPIGIALLIGFGGLTVLIGLLGVWQVQGAGRIHTELMSAHALYAQSEDILSEFRADAYRSGILLRDYLLDRSFLTAQSTRDQLIEVRDLMMRRMVQLEQRLPATEQEPMKRLREETESYWASIYPALEWTPAQKVALSAAYVQRELLARRRAVAELAEAVKRINAANLESERSKLDASNREYQQSIVRLSWFAGFLGLLIAAASVAWIHYLEQRAEADHKRAEEAEKEMRRLSHQVVHAQEEERKSLSRELHDQVGQVLTALRVELGNLRLIGPENRELFEAHVQEAKALAESSLRTVRDLAMGLRPSMLDDLGIGPALEWQAREFSRRNGIPATVTLVGPLKELNERQRTCLFRVVQEALTNITRHAGASKVEIGLVADASTVSLRVTDDGCGFETSRVQGRGLGLTSIEERVKELGGEVRFRSTDGQGTAVEIDLPRHVEAGAVAV